MVNCCYHPSPEGIPSSVSLRLSFYLCYSHPIYCRVAEKIVLRKWLQQFIPSSVIADQYACKPTGSTDAALVSMMHSVTYILERNNYVRYLMVDFSKAF